MNIGTAIKNTRKEKGITQKKLAELLEVSTITIQNYENSRRTPSIETIKVIAKALDTDVSNLTDDVTIDKSKKVILQSIAAASSSEDNSILNKFINNILETEGENFFKDLSKYAMKKRTSLKLGLNKICQFLNTDIEVLKSLENDGSSNPGLLVEYALLLDELEEPLNYINERLIAIPLLSDYTDFNLKELLELNKEQLDYFINSSVSFMKFALGEAKKL